MTSNVVPGCRLPPAPLRAAARPPEDSAPRFYAADQMEILTSEADREGFLDKVLGTNCFSAAVQELNTDCRRMSQVHRGAGWFAAAQPAACPWAEGDPTSGLEPRTRHIASQH